MDVRVLVSLYQSVCSTNFPRISNLNPLKRSSIGCCYCKKSIIKVVVADVVLLPTLLLLVFDVIFSKNQWKIDTDAQRLKWIKSSERIFCVRSCCRVQMFTMFFYQKNTNTNSKKTIIPSLSQTNDWKLFVLQVKMMIYWLNTMVRNTENIDTCVYAVYRCLSS